MGKIHKKTFECLLKAVKYFTIYRSFFIEHSRFFYRLLNLHALK
ncbi:hypothetical protein BACCAP_00916 [Pseudoflavonifractor capillosus ATCC 29799]|uniref:Uncharacterized protein n=1 Tax=Pseudoflavonifractor capillosus ATCC 29799 TaxID=411467 RepID=A6NRT8_9FIRM|nr:hypothetical protein BACCAP_00916 [Pseudoflavonifractor capillosus ATCC 29799]